MEPDIQQYAHDRWGDAVERLLEIEDSEDWEIMKRKDNWVGMRQKSETLFTLKGECLIDSDPQPIIEFIREPTNKVKFDKDIEFSEEVLLVDDNLKIVYHKIKTPPVLTSRDVLFVQGIREIEGNYYIASKSIEFAGKPPINGIIRANIIIAGYIVKPIEPGKSTLSYIMNVDPLGSIPKVVINLVQKSQIENVLRIRDHVMKGNK